MVKMEQDTAACAAQARVPQNRNNKNIAPAQQRNIPNTEYIGYDHDHPPFRVIPGTW